MIADPESSNDRDREIDRVSRRECYDGAFAITSCPRQVGRVDETDGTRRLSAASPAWCSACHTRASRPWVRAGGASPSQASTSVGSLSTLR